MKRLCRGQSGGVAMLLVVGFMLFGVAVVTSNLRLSTVLSTDSQVKNDILNRQYCALGVIEYVRYLTLDAQRWADWWTAHPDGTDTTFPCGDGAPGGIDIVLTGDPTASPVTSDESLLEGASLWPPPAYSSRKIQPVKTVSTTSEAVSADKTPFTYTITLTNRDDSSISLNKIHDNLPPGLKFLCGGMSTLLFPDGVTEQTVAPDPDEGQTVCPLDRHIVWNVTLLPTLQPYESVVLTFDADRSGSILSDGNYCNEAWAEPGDDNTKTGMTAPVKVGSVAADDDVCEGTSPGAKITKVISQIVDAVPTGSPLPSDTYQLTVEYSIEIENVGPVSLNLGPSGATGYGIRDLLPLGFCFVDDSATFQSASLANPSTNIPQGSNLCPSSDTRQRLDWDFSESIPSGETRTLIYRTAALVSAGNYWSDLLVNFTEFTDPSVYTWPSAVVMVRDSFTAEASVDGRAIVSFNVSMGGNSGSIVDFVIE